MSAASASASAPARGSAAAAVLKNLPPGLRSRLRQARDHAVGEGRPARARWCWAELSGRLCEISGQGPSAALTLAFALVLDAQREGESTAWIFAAGELFFPPDVIAGGVDLAALPVIRVPDAGAAARAASHLLRSGAFGLVVLDLGCEARLPMPAQARLVRQAQHHGVAVLCLSEKASESPSLGSLVSLRVHARRGPGGCPGLFCCELSAVKDKRRGPGWSFSEVCRGPAGLR